MKSPHILLLFLDGVGIGWKKHNPFFHTKLPVLNEILKGKIPYLGDSNVSYPNLTLKKINATLGISGLPQSGTGQTSLLTGVNAQKLIGKHFGPYIYSTLKPVLSERNLFRQLNRIGKKCFYANAYPHQYFEYIAVKNRITAITYSWMATGCSLNDHNSLNDGKSLSADITNERWHKLGYPRIPIITPYEAGKRLGSLTKEYAFVLYEYYYTDHVGHSQSMHEAVTTLEKLDSLIGGILDSFDQKEMLLMITSDHGNLEDLSTKSHTRNPVPLLVYGENQIGLSEKIKKISDITPAIVNLMN